MNPVGTNITGWGSDGLVRAYNLDLDADGDPTVANPGQGRVWSGWLTGDALIQIGFQSFVDPTSSVWQDAGTFVEGQEYKFSIDLAPGFENANQVSYVRIERASDGTELASNTIVYDWSNGSVTNDDGAGVSGDPLSVSYTATAADAGSAIRVRFGADGGGTGTSAFANPVLEAIGGGDPADLDGDGDVDDADFGIAFAAFTGPNNGPSSNPAADLDGDGDVDDADFGIAFAAFTGPGGAAVPEPTSLALLGLGGLLAARRRRA